MPIPATLSKLPKGSPVPAYTIFALAGEIANVPVAKLGTAASVVFRHVCPAFSVIQTPPPTVPMYHLSGLVGETTEARVLPGTFAGPLSANVTAWVEYPLLFFYSSIGQENHF